MFWRVKTSRRRQLPVTNEMAPVFKQLIGRRKAGFVFLNREFWSGHRKLCQTFDVDSAFRQHLVSLAATTDTDGQPLVPKLQRKAVTGFCRQMGQTPVKRIQSEFCSLTTEIGCPHFTRTHDLRHLFSSRAQEKGTNPLLVQEILGHATLAMTKRYTHLGLDAKRKALEDLKEK